MTAYDPVPCEACGSCFNWHDGAPGGTVACAACGEAVAIPLEPPPHPIPWEDRRRPAFRRWWKTFDLALFSPHRFFRGIPYEGGHRWPLRFVVFFFMQFFGALALLIPLFMIWKGSAERAWIGLLFGIVMAPLACGVVVALLYIMSAIDHFFLRLLGGKGSFEATLRVVAYTYPTAVARSMPVVGKFLHPAWTLLCVTFGFAAAHRISKTRAFFAGLLGLGVPLLLIVLAGFLYALLLPSLKKL